MSDKDFVIGKIEFATVTSGHLPSVAMPSGSGLAVPPDWRQLVQDRNHAVERQAVLETQVAALEAALSAIRALVQEMRTFQYDEAHSPTEMGRAQRHATCYWADRIAALCPAPPEDQP